MVKLNEFNAMVRQVFLGEAKGEVKPVLFLNLLVQRWQLPEV